MKTICFIVICLILFLALFPRAEAGDTWVKVSGGSWGPSPTMLTDLKAQIESYVKGQAKTQGRELKRWQDYTFQYQGREEKGRKFIFINALCIQSDRQRLDKEMIIIFDGGSCFFNLRFDPDRNEFFDLFINGEA